VTLTFRFSAFVAAAIALVAASPAHAVTEIAWWHAMSGELGRQLEKLAADFNATQAEYRIVPTYKGNYTETVRPRFLRSARAASRPSCRLTKSRRPP